MPGDVIASDNADYIMRRVRGLYLNDSTVTIVMVGHCTWSRKFVDWEVAASLRNTANSRRNGLLAIALPSISTQSSGKLPPRVADNVSSEGFGYAHWWRYPDSEQALGNLIEVAYQARDTRGHLVDNSRQLYSANRTCC